LDVVIAEDIKAAFDLFVILYSNELNETFERGTGNPMTGARGACRITESGRRAAPTITDNRKHVEKFIPILVLLAGQGRAN